MRAEQQTITITTINNEEVEKVAEYGSIMIWAPKNRHRLYLVADGGIVLCSIYAEDNQSKQRIYDYETNRGVLL